MRSSTPAQTSDTDDDVAAKKKRASGPSGKNHGVVMTLRVPRDDDTRERLQAAATRAGKPFSAWALALLLAHAPRLKR